MQEFSAKIYKVGINPAVDVPERVSSAFRKSGYIPVKGTLNQDTPFRATLCPTGAGNYRLYINGSMRQRAGTGVGKQVVVRIAFDAHNQEPAIPNVLAQALAKQPKAKVRFDAMASSRRKEVLAYLNSLKTQEALERNVQKFMAKLASSTIKIDGNPDGS